MNNQVDLAARKRLCGLMRQFAIGRITNHEFDDAFEGIDTKDRTLYTIGDSTFAYYNEYRTVRLRQEFRLSRSERRMVTRWILFLQSGYPYDNIQPPFRVRLREFLSGLTCGIIAKSKEVEMDEYYEAEIWPFTTQADFDEARRHPKLLCGRPA